MAIYHFFSLRLSRITTSPWSATKPSGWQSWSTSMWTLSSEERWAGGGDNSSPNTTIYVKAMVFDGALCLSPSLPPSLPPPSSLSLPPPSPSLLSLRPSLLQGLSLAQSSASSEGSLEKWKWMWKCYNIILLLPNYCQQMEFQGHVWYGKIIFIGIFYPL